MLLELTSQGWIWADSWDPWVVHRVYSVGGLFDSPFFGEFGWLVICFLKDYTQSIDIFI